ncbi:hypothetical protein V6N12_022742 [Hibiscus sabdariffa]|uniref:Uncharacterized protein n=1 Tax=Hibiscus sabdariffa TaxID=183260 RepID=A0ABR2FVS7_9ROSI
MRCSLKGRAAAAASLPHQPRSNALSLALCSTLQFVVSFIFVYLGATPLFFFVAYTYSSVFFNGSLHYHWFISESGSCCVSVHLPCSVIQISKIRFYMQCTLAIDQYHRR